MSKLLTAVSTPYTVLLLGVNLYHTVCVSRLPEQETGSSPADVALLEALYAAESPAALRYQPARAVPEPRKTLAAESEHGAAVGIMEVEPQSAGWDDED